MFCMLLWCLFCLQEFFGQLYLVSGIDGQQVVVEIVVGVVQVVWIQVMVLVVVVVIVIVEEYVVVWFVLQYEGEVFCVYGWFGFGIYMVGIELFGQYFNGEGSFFGMVDEWWIVVVEVEFDCGIEGGCSVFGDFLYVVFDEVQYWQVEGMYGVDYYGFVGDDVGGVVGVDLGD